MSALRIMIPVLLTSLVASMNANAGESAAFADRVIQEHNLSGPGAATLRQILLSSPATRNIGTEDMNAIMGTNQSVHPVSRAACVKKVLDTGLIKPNEANEKICGARWMAPIPEGKGSGPETAKVCVDQFEFPNIPCEYPVVWASASIANKVCRSMGKRVCNSHEWEGACGGYVDNQDPYRFKYGQDLNRRKNAYNQEREKSWAFDWDPTLKGIAAGDLCAVYDPNDDEMDSRLKGKAGQYFNSIGKSLACHTTNSDYKSCGTNTYPSGFKNFCRSRAGVYDMHGNVAEVVNFPVTPAGIAKGSVTDHTERKGSFFVIRRDYPDDCRVRQPYEHFHNVAIDNHAYYQEGFRCCKDIAE